MADKENAMPLRFKNLEEMKPHYDRLHLANQNPRVLLQKLDSMYKKASENMNMGDLEQAYITLMKYLSVLSFIQQSRDYKKDPKYYKAMLSRQPNMAINLAEKLSKNLSEQYDKQTKRSEVINNKENIENIDVSNFNITIEEPDMRVKKESKSALSSAELFSLLKDGVSKVLLMDARPSTDYESSRIAEESVVSVPDEIIAKGASANTLEHQLSDDSKTRWKLRGTYDHVVLLDWITNADTLDKSKLAILKDILTKWDINTNYKNEIVILDGGYEDWLSSYPWYTTNPKPTRPYIEDNANDVFLDQVIYPDLDDLNANVEEESLRPYFDRSKKPLKRTLNDVDYTVTEEVTEKLDETGRPSFDRAKKAAAIKTYEERKADMENLLTQKALETSAAVELEKSMLDNEKELRETIRRKREMEADEEQRQLLEERAEQLLMTVDELKIESAQKDNKIKELEKQIEVLEKKNVEEKEVEDEEQEIREAEINEQIKLQEQEKEKLAREREELERAKDLERKEFEEKYQEKLKEARRNKKRTYENEFVNASPHILVNEASNRTPLVNRSNKPRFEERIRQFNGVRGNVGQGLTGLKNLGNTCYMNSILQCINNNSVLVRYFVFDLYKDDVNRLSKTRGEIAEEIALVMKTLWTGRFRSIACRDFKNTVGSYKPEYATYEQQDSHEFLTFLMDWLHDDLKKARNPSTIEDEPVATEAEKAWRNFQSKNDSLILALFYGLQKSTVTCLKCDEESVTFEPFSDLSLIIPEGETCTLDQCLRLYLKSERISGWRCPKCGDFRDAEKKTDLCKLPKILVIHLKRFHYVEVLSRKRTTYVDFPLSDLNMSQHTFNHKQRQSYDLYGVSNHYGTMEGGHYTAYCKNPMFKKWYKFDDHEVVEISSSDVKSSAAYILFYSAINCPIPNTNTVS